MDLGCRGRESFIQHRVTADVSGKISYVEGVGLASTILALAGVYVHVMFVTCAVQVLQVGIRRLAAVLLGMSAFLRKYTPEIMSAHRKCPLNKFVQHRIQ